MKIRRFYAKDMRTGLKQVSQEMGPEAAILSTNNVNGGIEIVAATDYEEAIRFSKLDQQTKPDLLSEEQLAPSNNLVEQINLQQQDLLKPRRDNKISKNSEKLSNFKASINQPKPKIGDFESLKARTIAATDINTERKQLPNRDQVNWGSDPVISNVHDELRLLRGLLQGQIAESDWGRRQQQTPVEAEILKRLVNLGLPVELAENYAEVDENVDLGDAWYRVAATLAHDIPIADSNIIDAGGCYALVGPTGVGKTTTIAKLAAIAVTKYGADSVALISTDSYRIAAHQQLAIYAQIMGVEVVSVADGHQLDKALSGFKNKKLILIDTAGIGQRDQRLSEQLTCLNVSAHKINHLLVLSATSQLANLHESVKRFGQFRLQGAILTKLDEATSLGKIIATIIRAQLALFYVTDGQNVPEDIHQAKAHQLVTEAISLANQYPPETAEQWRLAQNLKRVS